MVVPVVMSLLAWGASHAEPSGRTKVAEHVIIISVDGMGSEYVKALLASDGEGGLPTFKRFQAEGAGTLNARDDAGFAVTLPNHVSMITSRGVNGVDGHGWTSNKDPKPTDTLATVKGSYVASAFDVAHDNALRTGLWSGKAKFGLFQQSYDSTTGAEDVTGPDNGRDKIDYDKVVAGMPAADLTEDFIRQMTDSPFALVFFHYQDPDSAGHGFGWSTDPASEYAKSLRAVDSQIGRILRMVVENEVLRGKTAIILTSDHGGHEKTHGSIRNPLDYTIPFYVWGPGVQAGADLYALNSVRRAAPAADANPPYGTDRQPIRNGEAANLALRFLGLGPVPGSTINIRQDLAVAAAGQK